jgi:hypothetical protein
MILELATGGDVCGDVSVRPDSSERVLLLAGARDSLRVALRRRISKAISHPGFCSDLIPWNQ